MQEEALHQFLSAVRCDRFVDYLDPIGETAEEALVRRIRWAQTTRNDPAYADEALFLLKHEQDLLRLLAREQDETGWAEGVMAGQEFGGKDWSTRGEVTELPDLDTSLAGVTEPPPLERAGIMVLDDDDDQVATPAAPARAPAPPIRAPAPSSPVAGVVQSRGKVRTVSPAGPRISAPTLSTLVDMPSIPPMDEIERRRQAARNADHEATDPSARPTPDLAKAIAAAAANTITPAPAKQNSALTDTPVDPELHAVPIEERSPPWGLLAAFTAALFLGAIGAWAYVNATGPTPGPAGEVVSKVVTPPAPVVTPPAPVVTPPAPVVTPPDPVVTPPAVATPAAADPAPIVPDPVPVVPAPVAPPPVQPVLAPVRPTPEPVRPVPAPVRPVAVEPVPVVPRPVEPVAKVPEQAPVPSGPSVSADALAGMWGGALGGGDGFMLRVFTNDEQTFTGSAEILGAGDHTTRHKITGRIEGDKITFSDGGSVSFSGAVSGRTLTGTVKRGGIAERLVFTR